ncbi:MAG: periplasmic heavy metal sensor [Ignavibacteriales bacterium]|nr:periplasmic heavy metal sensor [Ignavibacteriales bacterium]
MKKNIIVTLVFAVLLSGSLFAQPDGCGMGKRGFGKMQLKEKLNLSAEQEKQFSDITYKHQSESIDLRAKVQKNRLELKNLLDNKNVDEQKVLALTEENSKLQAQLKQSAVKTSLAIYKTLDKEQKDIWAESFMGTGMRGGNDMHEGQMMRGIMRERMHRHFMDDESNN